MNANRARHLENALLHFDEAVLGGSVVGARGFDAASSAVGHGLSAKAVPDEDCPDPSSSLQKQLPLDLFLRRYFQSHRHLKAPDRTFIAEHMYELVRWRGLLDQAGGGPYVWANRMKTFFVSERWRSLTDSNKLPPHVRGSVPPALFSRLEHSRASSAGATGGVGSLGGGGVGRRDEDGRVTDSAEPSAVGAPAAAPARKLALHICNVLNEKPVTFLRCNVLTCARDQMFKYLLSKGIPVEMTQHSPIGLQLATASEASGKQKLLELPEYKLGQLEIQNESSQLMGLAVDAKPGQKVMDFCAGAGGKALVFGPKMRNTGQ
eukprot:gene249-279_t